MAAQKVSTIKTTPTNVNFYVFAGATTASTIVATTAAADIVAIVVVVERAYIEIWNDT